MGALILVLSVDVFKIITLHSAAAEEITKNYITFLDPGGINYVIIVGPTVVWSPINVWEKDIWDFQIESGTSGSCTLFLHFMSGENRSSRKVWEHTCFVKLLTSQLPRNPEKLKVAQK